MSPPKYYTSFPNWNSNYLVFMKPVLPETRTVTFKNPVTPHWDMVFKRWKPALVPQWKIPIFGEEDTPSKIDSYIGPCSGDSGAGNFIANVCENNPKTAESFRFILVAVYRSTFDFGFEDSSGEIHPVPCGTHTYDEINECGVKGIIDIKAVATSITWPKILRWIKARMKKVNEL